MYNWLSGKRSTCDQSLKVMIASFSFFFFFTLSGELNELTRERDMAQVERKCEHHAVESAKNAAREMQKQAAKSAEKAGKNKGTDNKCLYWGLCRWETVVSETLLTLSLRFQWSSVQLRRKIAPSNSGSRF